MEKQPVVRNSQIVFYLSTKRNLDNSLDRLHLTVELVRASVNEGKIIDDKVYREEDVNFKGELVKLEKLYEAFRVSERESTKEEIRKEVLNEIGKILFLFGY